MTDMLPDRAEVTAEPDGEVVLLREWQLCPKCLGSKVQGSPPGIPADQWFMSTSVGPWPCVICAGAGLVLRPAPD